MERKETNKHEKTGSTAKKRFKPKKRNGKTKYYQRNKFKKKKYFVYNEDYKQASIKELKKRYPSEIVEVFETYSTLCEVFYRKMEDLSTGRHILDLSPLHIYELRNGTSARRNALISILGEKDATRLKIFTMKSAKILILSDYAYEKIHKGLEEIVVQLDINCYISPDKIINAGNAIKNHNGAELYGGDRIRNYITHLLSHEKPLSMTDEEFDACKTVIKETIVTMQNYKAIKSIPFSIFRYDMNIRTDEDNNIVVPDVEAKYNIKRIIGVNNYNKAPFRKLSIAHATVFEARLIQTIKETVKKESERVVKEVVADMKDSKLKKDILKSSNVEYISIVTSKCLIHDIIDYMKNNAERIKKLDENPSLPFTQDDKDSLIQIEYVANQSNMQAPGADNAFRMAIASKHCTYRIAKELIELGFIPLLEENTVFTAFIKDIPENDILMILQDRAFEQDGLLSAACKQRITKNLAVICKCHE